MTINPVQHRKKAQCYYCGQEMFKMKENHIPVCYSCKEKGRMVDLTKHFGKNKQWKIKA